MLRMMQIDIEVMDNSPFICLHIVFGGCSKWKFSHYFLFIRVAFKFVFIHQNDFKDVNYFLCMCQVAV